MTVEEIFAEFIRWRALERLSAIALGGAAIAFGYHLFRVGVVSAQSAELESGSFKVRLQKVGPGVFFSLFGALLVGYISYVHPSLESVSETAKDLVKDKGASIGDKTAENKDGTSKTTLRAGFSAASPEEAERLARAVNTVFATAKALRDDPALTADQARKEKLDSLIAAALNLERIKGDMIFGMFPPAVHDACIERSKPMPEGYTADTCKRIEELETGTL